MISKILIALKDAHSMDITESFISSLQTSGALTLKILHTIEPEQTKSLRQSKESEQEATALVESTCRRLSNRFANLKVIGCVRIGAINQEIVEEASIWGADLILMGPYGRHGTETILHDSAARAVLPNAPCSVVLLRAQHEKHRTASSISSITAQSNLKRHEPLDLNDSSAHGMNCSLSPIIDSQFVQDVSNMCFCRRQRDEETIGNLLIGQTIDNERQYF